VRRIVVAVCLLVLALLVGGYLYFFVGLKSYLLDLVAISKIADKDSRSKAEQIFWNGGGSTGYSGTISSIDRKGGGVWVWGKRGLRHYRFDSGTVLTRFELCTDQTIRTLQDTGSFEVNKYVTSNINDWKAREGDFVKIIAPNEVGVVAEKGQVREVQDHDWPEYLPSVDLGATCGE